MPILYGVVARGTTVLAKYATCAGNFQEITEHILKRIGPEDAKMTYTQANYLFHYIVEGAVIYLCITDDDFERSKAFLFLNEIKKRFKRTYQQRAQTALPYAMQSEFSRVMAAEMNLDESLQLDHLKDSTDVGTLPQRHYSDPLATRQSDSMARVEEELDELKGIMVKNIETVAQRGERLELLVEKSEDLSATSLTFKKHSRGLARAMCMKNVKIIIVIVIVCILVLYFIVSAVCGFDWSNCGKKSS